MAGLPRLRSVVAAHLSASDTSSHRWRSAPGVRLGRADRRRGGRAYSRLLLSTFPGAHMVVAGQGDRPLYFLGYAGRCRKRRLAGSVARRAPQEVELPIVKLEKLPARRRTSGIQIATLSPLDPSGPDHIAAENIKGRYVREGDCLAGVVERGWLGGLWVRHFEARPCSKERGTPGSHVIVPASGFSSWRWHQPRDFRPKPQGQAWDDALPADVTCRIRPGAWLYRCSPKTS